jgi:hypothetical protein
VTGHMHFPFLRLMILLFSISVKVDQLLKIEENSYLPTVALIIAAHKNPIFLLSALSYISVLI